MKFTAPVFFLIFGLLITTAFTFVPLIYDPVIMKLLPEEPKKDKDINIITGAYAVSQEFIYKPNKADIGFQEKTVRFAIKTTWFIFVPFFLFPLSVMLALHWYERRKIRKIAKSNLALSSNPKVSLIFSGRGREWPVRKIIKETLSQNPGKELKLISTGDKSAEKIFEIADDYSGSINSFFKGRGRISILPKVSLIFPAYNEEKFIHKTIEQGLNQDYQGELEIIIIDDGSTDRTFEIVQEFGSRHENVKIYKHEANKGKPEALNTGFAKATGQISIFSDSDSYLDSDLVSKIVPHFRDPQVGMVAGMIIIDNEINTLTKLQQIEYLYNQEIVRFCQATHKGVLICPGAATAVRTEIAGKIPSTERTVTEDADFTFEVLKAGWKVSQEPEAISRTDAPDNWRELIMQRKRWLYGVLQTINIHRWSLFFKGTKTPNLWVWWAWVGYFSCPITTLAVIAIPLFTWLIGINYLIFLGFYSLLVGVIFVFAHYYGIKQYSHENKTKLTLFLPLYMIYQYLLNVLLFFLLIAFVIRKGIVVRYGGRKIHAV